jgi:YD repeat-containing protein
MRLPVVENKMRELILMTEPMKILKRYTYDAENQVTSVTYEDGVIVSYTYDKAGNRISVTRSGSSGAFVPFTTAVQAEPRSKQTIVLPSPVAQHLCGNCGNPVKSGKKFCSNCGAPVSASVMVAPVTAVPPPSSVCTACGNPIKLGAKFCGKCGRNLT